MNLIWFTVALATLLLAGGGAALLLLPRERKVNTIELLSLAVLLGAAFVSLSSFWLGLLLSGAALQLAVTVAGLAIAAAGFTARRQLVEKLKLPSSEGAILMLAALAAQAGLVIWLSVSTPLGWDAQFSWEIKARIACLSGGVIPISYFSDLTRTWSSPDYPLFLPLTQAWFYSWLGECYQGMIKLVFPLFYLAALGLLYTGGLRFGGRHIHGLFSSLLLFFLPLAVLGNEGSVSSGYADFPLAVVYLAAVLYLLEYWESEKVGALRLLACLSAVLPWVKQDGLVLWLCLMGLMAVKLLPRKQFKLFLLVALPGILLFGPWMAFLKLVNAFTAQAFHPLTPARLWSNLGRLPFILQAVAREIVNWKHWALLWPGLLLALPLFRTSQRRKQAAVLFIAVIVPILCYSGVYLFSNWNPFTDHVNSSLSRLLLQVSLVPLLMMGLALPAESLSLVSSAMGRKWLKIEENSLLKRALMAAVLVLLPLLYFYPAVIGEVLLAPGDGWTQIIGIRVLIGQMLAQGELPLWNPYIFGGMPLLASIQPGALYPPTWLFAFFSPGVAMNAMVITSYHLALIGSYLYARRIGIGRLGSLTTGIAFTFGGYMIAHLGHTNRVAAAAWLPWVLLAIEHLYLRASWRWVTFGALFVALQLFAGDPQMTLYTVLVGGAYGLFSLTVREARQPRWRFLAATVALALCGTLLSLIQLLPEQELLEQTERAGISYEYFSSFSLPPQQTLSLIFPYFFGGAIVQPPYTTSYWGLWNTTETCGYVGLLTLLLSLVAVLGQRRRALMWFWVGSAGVSLLLAFGSFLPFGLNHLLHKLPVYNLFRASGRHLLEFTFALAVLAGLGVNYLAEIGQPLARRVLQGATVTLTLLVVCTAIIYCFFGQYLIKEISRPEGAGSLTDTEAFIPLTFWALGTAVLWFYAHRRTVLAGSLLFAVLLADLVSFGHFYEWRVVPYRVTGVMSDTVTVKYIKEREPDLAAFRILSHAAQPYGNHYNTLNYPNISIVRGLQSVNGYDPVRLLRQMAIAGEMGLDGVVHDKNAFDQSHQGFNLLNVKYLLWERPGPLEEWRGRSYEGIRFSEAELNLELAPGMRRTVATGRVVATELAIISAMRRSTHIPDGAPIVRIKLHTTSGQLIERELKAGRDTSEWAYDRPDVHTTAKHQRARVVESWAAEGFQGHHYLARLAFERAEIDHIEFEYCRDDADIRITRASLYDAETGASTPLERIDLPPERWRKLASFGQIDLYENLKRMPRAWFTSHLAVMPSAEVLRAIKTGRMRDGSPFDPAQTALLELEDFGSRAITLPPVGEAAGAEVKITRYEPHRIELETRHSQAGFLLLSEIYYRGWDAWVDGKKTPVERVNYALRGIAVPPGEHHIEFVFRAPTFRDGALYSALGLIVLLVGLVVERGQAKRAQASSLS